MKRAHNFNAGPSALPLPVLEEAQRRLVDHGEGLSVLEMSHRSKAFQAILDEAKERLARLLSIPEDYEILFLQGGASLQFGMVPMNLGPGGAYVTTGSWAEKALGEARLVGTAHEVWSAKSTDFRKVPRSDEQLPLPEGSPYLHICTNNTIYGTQWHHFPQVPCLVADMSSDILSRPLNVSKFGLIYAGAQKNAGPAGVTLVIGRRELLREFRGEPTVPKILRYGTHVDAGSLYNTANTFGVWLCALVYRWIEEQGGLREMERQARRKAQRLYEVIDTRPDVFTGHAEASARSWMNVVFRLPTQEAEQRFLQEAREAGCVGLEGHRSVGGVRASIYNAVPMESVEVLATLMERFEP